VAEGWYAGRFGWEGGRHNIYGDDIGLIAQLEINGSIVLGTGDDRWETRYGELITSELYDGEQVDTSTPSTPWFPCRSGVRPYIDLVSPSAPPVRSLHVQHAYRIFTTPSGKTVVDFGQNLVGFVRFDSSPPLGSKVTLRHAEVMEEDELGTRPLRECKATDTIQVGRDMTGWTPKFTFHGFRYVQVDGWPDIKQDYLSAVVIYTDMERIGDFSCSHTGLSKFHQNTLWGLRGNFVSVPTDCPQRDERLGWTGDLQVKS
jgi:alpha-L-rhamnosidase